MKSKQKRIFIITFVATLVVLLGSYLGVSFYFRSHFFIGSVINGIDCSRMTVSEVEDSIKKEVANYVLQIDGRNDLTDIISADDIQYKYISDGSVKQLLQDQNSLLWVSSLFSKNTKDMQITTSYDEDLLTKKMDSLLFLKEENMIPPTDAHTVYEDGSYKIAPETQGSEILMDSMKDAIISAVKDSETYINLDKKNCYKKPAYTTKSEELVSLVKQLNTYVNVVITYDFKDRYEIVDSTFIHDWLDVTSDFKVEFNYEKVRNYIDSIASIYNTFGKKRDFKNHEGKIIEVSGGDYGWLINRAEETERLVSLIQEGKNVQVEPTYSQTARSRERNDIGDSYIEIDLTKQHVWVFENGKLITDTDCVTGNVRKQHDTPSGIYQLTYKERGATLRGQDYNSEVEYWMPFYYNVGLHDAPWRKSFGGKIYKTSGSHGCVNLPPAAAKTIFEHVQKGTPVVVYSSKEK